jgi:hypothetical protein
MSTLRETSQDTIGWVYPGLPSAPPAPPPETVAGSVQLISGQNFIDVVFDAAQLSANYILIGSNVVNTTDATPLNVAPGIVTEKTTTGFRMYLLGVPDTGHYFLDWEITVATPVTGATGYILSGPSSGPKSVASTFTVQLTPSGAIIPDPIIITPSDGGAGGVFAPTSLTLDQDSASGAFTYTPSTYGARTISTTNDGGLPDPSSIAFTSVAATYLLSGPSSGVSGVASTAFTVELPTGGVVVGTMIVTPHDASAGGTFTPTTVNLTTAAPSATFTYTPASAGTKTISVTNNKGLTNPGNLTYTATAPSLADGDPVTTWPDSSGNGHDATQTGSARPIFKTAILNGKPVVRFTAAGLSGLNIASAVSAAEPWTVLVVVKPATPTSQHFSLINTTTVNPSGPFFFTSGTILYIGDRAGLYNAGAAPYATAFHIHRVHMGVAGPTAYITDGASIIGGVGVLTPNANPGGNFNAIGAMLSGSPAYSDGDIAEIIVYNVNLSGLTDGPNLDKYLGTKYGITVPAGTAVQPDTIPGLVAWWKADSL